MEIKSENKSIKMSILGLLLLAILLFVFIVYILGSNQKMFSSTYSLYIFMNNTHGVEKGSFVTLAGIKAGVVGDMEYVQKNGQPGVKIQLKIDKNLENKITQSSIASIKTKGVLGSKYIDISLGESNETPLEHNVFIQSHVPTDMAAIGEKVAAAVDTFQNTLNNVNKMTSTTLDGEGLLGTLIVNKKAKDDFLQIMTNLHTITALLEEGEGTAGKFIRSDELYNSLQHTLSNLETISRKLEDGDGTLGKLISQDTLHTRLNTVSAQMTSLLEQMQGTGTVGRLVEEQELYDQLLSLTKNLNELTEEIKKNPKKFFKLELF